MHVFSDTTKKQKWAELLVIMEGLVVMVTSL